MAERIADNADLAVDELRKRARRRLVGAIVLALAAAVVLPLLLEKEPKPLGDDVSVQIPPIDEGRFINRLTGRATDAKSLSKSDPKAQARSASPKSDAPTAAPGPIATAPATPAAEDAPAPALTNVPAPKKSIAEAEQRVLATGGKPAVPSDVKPDAKPGAPPTAAAAPAPPASVTPPPEPAAPVSAPLATGDGFAVQIAAFTDDKGANALAAKLKKAGYDSVYTEPAQTSRGTMWRVRVGGFATKPDAEAARSKLKAEGWNGLVVAAK